MNKRRRWIRYLPGIALVTLSCLIGAAVFFMKGFFDKPVQRKRVIQQISLIKPPPPPPPKEEPPPPPEPEEKVEIPEPEEIPEELPEMADEPPAGDLGLDAEGGAGSDSFGLVGHKGGRGLLSGGSPFAWYASLLQRTIQDELMKQDRFRKHAFSVLVRLWVNHDGHVSRVKVSGSTGDPKVDEMLNQTLSHLKVVDQTPPLEMPQPIILRIKNRT